MRYGILDKVEDQYLEGTRDFNIYEILNFGGKVLVESLVSGYTNFIKYNLKFSSRVIHEQKIITSYYK